MAYLAPQDFDVTQLRDKVRTIYQQVADSPDGEFHFHRGAEYAAGRLGYDRVALAAIPTVSTDAFAGVGNPHAVGPIHEGETVLDHACGAGTDLLLAAVKVGAEGRAIGVDMTPGMRDRAQRGAAEMGLTGRVEVLAGYYEDLPLADESVDVVISNGVLNLAPNKVRVLQEIARVLRPGGRLHMADVIVQRELKLAARCDPDLWAACIGGALPEPEVDTLFESVGLVDLRKIDSVAAFASTSAEDKVSADLEVAGMTFFARKPEA